VSATRVIALLLAVLLMPVMVQAMPTAQSQSEATATTLAELQRRIARVVVLRGEFAQDKQLPGFSKPLHSEGQFLLAEGRGLYWQTLRPQAAELVLTADKVRSRSGGNVRETELRSQPALRAINRLLFALMRGDLHALQKQFALQPVLLDGGRWQLLLTPKGGAARALRQIRLEGDRYLRSLVIEERQGGVTRLAFSALRETPAQLSDDEARRFD
jgi:outer membrane lipoprotein-sorting protein